MAMTTGTPLVEVLRVSLHGREVGTLTLLPGDGSLFTFEEGYLDDPGRPTLSLSYKTVDGGVASPGRPTRQRVPPFFSNLLPEGRLRDYLAHRAGVNPRREFFLLRLLGADLPGAVVVTAHGEHQVPAGMDRPSAASPGQPLRFSLAGVQLKFSALLEADGVLTIPADGVGGSWIVKLPSPRYPAVPQSEFAMMELARAVGIEVPEVRLVDPTDILNLPRGVEALGPALAVRRFDRGADGTRIHTEDFAQVFNLFPARKYERASYENIARVLWAEAGLESVVEFARRLVFSVLIGNADMHLKNWSLRYPDGVHARLAPAYDLVPTVAYLPDDASLALSLGGVREMAAVRLATFARFAARAGVPEKPVLDAVQETEERVREEWSRLAALNQVPADLRRIVADHLRRVSLG
jgi:serine/threonine-protein kinase HipA